MAPLFTRHTRVSSHRRRVGPSGICCLVGLIPTTLIFLTFMFIFPNKSALLSVINFHSRKTSPILNRLKFRCGFTPSCSEYSRIAIEKYGLILGGFKSILRICSCNPANKNRGYDYP